MNQQYQRQRGVTLLELLVALSVFAVIGVSAFSGLDAVLNTRAQLEQESQRLAAVQMAMYFIERDLEQIVPRSIRNEFGQRQAALAGGRASSALLEFSRAGWQNPLQEPRSSLQRLSYRLQDKQLYRRYWLSLDRAGITEPREMVLLDAVEDVQLRFLDQANRWQNTWPPAQAESVELLPRAVEITMRLSDWGELTRLLRIVDT